MYVLVARRADLGDLIRDRVEALARFYGRPSSGAGAAAVVGAGPLVGLIGAPAASDLVCWGSPFGAAVPGVDEVLGRTDARLRKDLIGWGMCFAQHEQRARLVSAPSGPAAGYHAHSEDLEVWASHAVAASWLACGRAKIDASRLPELLGYDFVGGGETLIDGVKAIPPATVIDYSEDSHEARTYWPQAERWAPMAAGDAQRYGELALMDSLERRLHGGGSTALGLTGGADSRVLAVALAELDVPTVGFTWGEQGWPDVEHARHVAQQLEMRWSASVRWRDDDDTRASYEPEMRWADGCVNIAPSEREWPAGTGAVLTGAAGEVGRAFFYRADAHRSAPRTAAEIADLLYPEGRLPHASEAAKAQVRTAVSRWADAALASGRSGWEAMDVLYSEQRVTHWLRTQMPMLDASFVGGFMPVEVMRGLASLPLAEKLTDGFHRRFIEARRPDLALAAPRVAPSPSRATRAVARVRARIAPSGHVGAPPANSFLVALWESRPVTREWIADSLGAPLLLETLGELWVDSTRERFLRGEERAHHQACLACGPVALSDALAGLRTG